MRISNRKLLTLLLAVVLAVSCLPICASAAAEIKNYNKVTYVQQPGTGEMIAYFEFDTGTVVVHGDTVLDNGGISEFKVGDKITVGAGGAATTIAAHEHAFEWTVTRDGHFYRCTCGSKHHFAEHFHTGDRTCICGYEFMDNADLTVLWMSGIRLSPALKKDVTEYEGKLLVKGQKELQISAFPFDAKATVELPEDLSLKQGTNVFKIKVTAEDGLTTKTYTVTVENE